MRVDNHRSDRQEFSAGGRLARRTLHPLWGLALIDAFSSLAARVHVDLKRMKLPAQWLVRLTLQD